jgi:7,8-dihydropterin-6-yl-methyl-4-(beta-D-ribofuranosyl)aminobenzene 5'-phosphate synthase
VRFEEMKKDQINLPAIDEVRITIIVDNSVDLLLASTDKAKRFALGTNPFENLLPVAEHGFSVLIRAKKGNKIAEVLFDTGVSKKGILHNLDTLEINLSNIQGIILSHGHPDHALGLSGLIDRLGTRNLPLVLHPDAFLERKLVLPDGSEVRLPPPRIADFRRENIEVMEEPGPSMLVDDMVLVSGEVSRTTSFEKGFPIHYAHREGTWVHDPLIMDDQCAILNVHDKGLVIVTGCGHSGIINIIKHARKLTGIEKIYAVIGGFHLSGKIFEPIIPDTISALKEIAPAVVVPGHCTGWIAQHKIAREMPDAFIPNSVGTTLFL